MIVSPRSVSKLVSFSKSIRVDLLPHTNGHQRVFITAPAGFYVKTKIVRVVGMKRYKMSVHKCAHVWTRVSQKK